MTSRYANGKIYSIRSLSHPEEVYIGSTCMPLHKRLHSHRASFYMWRRPVTRKNPGYMSSFEMIKYDDHYIELVENFPCDSKDVLRRREGQVIRETDCINRRVEGRTREEWYQDNKEHVCAKTRKWQQNNPERRKAKDQACYQANKAHRSGLVECDVCKCTLTRGAFWFHNKSKKHLDALQVSNDCVSPALSSV